MSLFRVLKKLNRILSKHQKIRVIELTLLMIVGGFLEMCSVSLIIPFISVAMNPEILLDYPIVARMGAVLPSQKPEVILAVSAFLIALLYIFKNLYLLFEYNIQYRFVYSNMFEVQKRILDNYLHRPYESFLDINSGEVMRVINNDTFGGFGLLTTVLALFTELIVSGMLIVAIFISAPVITIGMTIVFMLQIYVMNLFLKPILKEAAGKNQVALSKMNQWLLQSIQGIKEIKVMSKERFFQKQYNNYGKEFIDAERKNKIFSILPKFILEALSMGSAFVMVAVLLLNGHDLQGLIPILSAMAMAMLRLLPSVNRISSSLASIAYHEPRLDNLIENLNELKKENVYGSVKKYNYIEGGNDKAIEFKNDISLNNITYRYPNGERDILNDADIIINKGESVGIVGASGAGKTTVIDVLMGLLAPQNGEIRVDGIDVSNNISEWRKMVGYIPQNIFLLDATIKENVAFGVSDDCISDDMVWDCLQEAALEEYVKQLPMGIYTDVGERGIRLSGGQKQRIGIARALYQNPDILVFDEATSALDSDTENSIMDSINKLRGYKTMIIIAHRLSTIESCDHIYRVENSKIFRER